MKERDVLVAQSLCYHHQLTLSNYCGNRCQHSSCSSCEFVMIEMRLSGYLLCTFTLNKCILIHVLNVKTFRTNTSQLCSSHYSKIMSLYLDLQVIHITAAHRKRTDLWQQQEVWRRTAGTRSCRA